MHIFHECLSIYVCASFPFGFVGEMWDLIVLIPVHGLSFYCSGEWTRLLLFKASLALQARKEVNLLSVLRILSKSTDICCKSFSTFFNKKYWHI